VPLLHVRARLPAPPAPPCHPRVMGRENALVVSFSCAIVAVSSSFYHFTNAKALYKCVPTPPVGPVPPPPPHQRTPCGGARCGIVVYYCVLLAWCLRYILATLAAVPSGQLPWAGGNSSRYFQGEVHPCPPLPGGRRARRAGSLSRALFS